MQVSIPKQVVDSILSVSVMDQYGNERSPYDLFVEDGTPPNKPIVDPITENDYEITGITEENVFVLAKTSTHNFIGDTWSDQDGKFSIPIGRMNVGTEIIAIAMDSSENVSEETRIIVKDIISPPPKY